MSINAGQLKSRFGQILFFLCAGILALQIIPRQPPFVIKLLPALSPYLAICSAIADRAVTATSLFALPLILIALFRGRWFCHHLCPTGFLTWLAGRVRPRAAGLCRNWPHLSHWVLLLTIGGAIAGYPLLLWLDPLSVFNGFFCLWTRPVIKTGNFMGLGLLLIIGLSLWRPNAWCYRICPLGFIQELLGLLRRWIHSLLGRKNDRKLATANIAHLGRRSFLVVLSGGIFGLLLRKFRVVPQPIRPPGVVPEDRLKALCARCGNCVQICPQHIIHADMNLADPAGLLTPIIRFDPGYCSEFCQKCTDVCPSGAIRPLVLARKQQTTIGLAEVTRSVCIAWNAGQYCMICHEHCPYHAIRSIEQRGVNCPEVDADICRGCGICQVKCPVDPKAIIVHSRPQKLLDPVEV